MGRKRKHPITPARAVLEARRLVTDLDGNRRSGWTYSVWSDKHNAWWAMNRGGYHVVIRNRRGAVAEEAAEIFARAHGVSDPDTIMDIRADADRLSHDRSDRLPEIIRAVAEAHKLI